MATTHWPVYSPIAKEHYGKGREDGLAEGKAAGKAETEVADARKLILMVLKARGLEPTDGERKQIVDCTDLEQLEKWAEAGLTATSTKDVFG